MRSSAIALLHLYYSILTAHRSFAIVVRLRSLAISQKVTQSLGCAHVLDSSTRPFVTLMLLFLWSLNLFHVTFSRLYIPWAMEPTWFHHVIALELLQHQLKCSCPAIS